MSAGERILYVGSGLSAKLASTSASKVDVTCAVNNAWRIFQPNQLGYWICPGDFPCENYPTQEYDCKKIGYYDFQYSAKNIFAKFGETYQYPQHHAGYTTFFQGLYWLFDTLQPREIYLLGFDHDYNQKKIALWTERGKPSPVNNYCGDSPKDANAWADSFFKDCERDAIYGHGTPDPLRLGEASIVGLFNRAKEYADRLNIKVFNASGVTTGLNNFPQIEL